MKNTFGEFLKQRRLEKNLTQKELANLLIISESAVSKWEKDVAHPDITLLPKLSEILGVSEHELITASIDRQAREEKQQAKKWRIFSSFWDLFFYISYGIALTTCFICNLAVNKTLSWFWIVLAALLLAFTFTNLPKLIKKHKLLLLPLSMFISLCTLLAVCCIYTNGNWFWIASLSILLGLTTIFVPIYISKYKKLSKIKKYNDFLSIGVDFLLLNILLIVIDVFSIANNYATNHWYLSIALPITAIIYTTLNILLCVRFLKTNKLLKTSIILLFIDLISYITPLFIKVENFTQNEINSLNVFKADFLNWQSEIAIERNIHCIIFITLLIISLTFLTFGIFKHIKNKNTLSVR